MKLFLCGDVMTGRGIDQILGTPCDPALEEPCVKDARDYVRLAEEASGPIPRRVEPAYVWGDALAELEREQPDARIINLETAVTTSSERAPKGINYRMNPANGSLLHAARIDCCVLANNHVLDWGRGGLAETLDTLHALGVRTAGAGRTPEEAGAPARVAGELLVFAFGLESAGVPPEWGSQVAFLPDLSARTADAVSRRILELKAAGDNVLVSLHWGPNWGYEVTREERNFARHLVDAGAADLVHGHSSHHPRPLEIHRDRLILYGCGDFLNDYEGIAGHEGYRPELTLMYFPVLEEGRLARLALAPMRIRRFRLQRASDEEARWLADRLGAKSGVAFERLPEGGLRLR